MDRYRAIGGGSPLAWITQEQAARLVDATGHLVPIRCAYRYASPTLEEMMNECYKSGTERITFFVMSPYYTSRTVGAYIKTVETYLSYLSFASYRPEVTFIHSWYKEPLFIDAWVGRIREEARQEEGFYLFSAHSLPQSLQHEPYISQVKETVAAVAARSNYRPTPSAGRACPRIRTSPGSGRPLRQSSTGRSRNRRDLEIPIGFVSDHLETLYEWISYMPGMPAEGPRLFAEWLPSTPIRLLSPLLRAYWKGICREGNEEGCHRRQRYFCVGLRRRS